MSRRFFAGMGILFFVFAHHLSFAWADGRDDEIAALKSQVRQMLRRIEALERAGEKGEGEIAAGTPEPNVLMDKAASKLKIQGRWAAGFFDSGKSGSYPPGSFEVPDTKIQLALRPDEINNIVARFNLNNGAFNSVDYSYIETDLQKFLNIPFPLVSQVGRIKLHFGEETAWNNPVEGPLPSNSAADADGKDEGFKLCGKLGAAGPLAYWISVTNGTSGTGSDASTAKSFTGKLSCAIADPVSVSASYHHSGSLKGSNAELAIAGLRTPPANAARWTRQVWEVACRYDFRKGKTPDPPAFSDSKAIIRLAYGAFSDDVSATAGLGDSSKRGGQYGFVEGTYNLTEKFYLAGRASAVYLDGDAAASLNGITANEYQRYSVGAGYRLTRNTILKIGYDWNRESGDGVGDADNNLFAAVVTSRF